MITAQHPPARLLAPSFWTSLFGREVTNCRAELIETGMSPSRVFRMHFGQPRFPTVILKDSRAPWPSSDPTGFGREAFVYERFVRRTSTVGPELIHCEADRDGTVIVLSDLEVDHEFKRSDHRWSQTEIVPVLETFARLHLEAGEIGCADSGPLVAAPNVRWQKDVILEAARSVMPRVVETPTSFLSDCEFLLASLEPSSWQQRPPTLLHSDFNASNVAFSCRSGEARLIDWHIASWGTPSFEIGSLFYQPHFNHLNLSRLETLQGYLHARYELDGVQFDEQEEWDCFRFALAYDGLSYLPPIARSLKEAGSLSGWWLNMLQNTVENLNWAAREHR